MKLLHLKQIESAIPKLINTDLPIKYAYLLNLVLDDLDKHLNHLQKFRADFLTKHGEKIDDTHIKIPSDKLQEFDQGMEELLQEEIDIKPVAIPLSVLFDSDIKLTVLEIESLKNSGFLIDDISKSEE